MTLWVDRIIKPSPTNASPAPGEQLRNDIAVAVVVLFALFLALGIRNQVYSASKFTTLNQGALRIAYPERWVLRATDDAAFTALHLGSPSTYDTRVEVSSRPLRPDETLDAARFDRGLKLSSAVSDYRELEATEMQVLNDVPAIVATYGFVDDPTLDAGAIGLPVVVEGQDVMFVLGDTFYAVSLRADATQWAENGRDFAVVTDSLRLRAAPAIRSASSAPAGFSGGAATPEGGQ